MEQSVLIHVDRTRLKIRLAIVFVLLNIGDVMTTSHALAQNVGYEGNPVMAATQALAGEWWPLIKFVAASALALTWIHVRLPYSTTVFALVNVVLAFVVWHNWTLLA